MALKASKGVNPMNFGLFTSLFRGGYLRDKWRVVLSRAPIEEKIAALNWWVEVSVFYPEIKNFNIFQCGSGAFRSRFEDWSRLVVLTSGLVGHHGFKKRETDGA